MNQCGSQKDLKARGPGQGGLQHSGCPVFEDLWDTFPQISNTLDALRRSADFALDLLVLIEKATRLMKDELCRKAV